MSEDDRQKGLAKTIALVANRFRTSGELAPIEDRTEWEKLVASQPPEERELLEELSRFADLWRYFRERNERLGPMIVESLGGLHKLPVTERISRLKQINLNLMERVGDDGQGSQSRQ